SPSWSRSSTRVPSSPPAGRSERTRRIGRGRRARGHRVAGADRLGAPGRVDARYAGAGDRGQRPQRRNPARGGDRPRLGGGRQRPDGDHRVGAARAVHRAASRDLRARNGVVPRPPAWGPPCGAGVVRTSGPAVRTGRQARLAGGETAAGARTEGVAAPVRDVRRDLRGGSMTVDTELAGPDGLTRCSWANTAPDYADYHDTEWGVPLRGVTAVFARMSQEAFQSGMSWLPIQRKRAAFRAAIAGFGPVAVAAFGDDDVARLLAAAGIVRNREKIHATIGNARAVAQLHTP